MKLIRQGVSSYESNALNVLHAFPGHETREENFLMREEFGAAIVTDFRPADTGGLQLQERLDNEALHSAGMREAPAYPGELTSAQIQAMVEDQCGL
jgi:hypothetical protein